MNLPKKVLANILLEGFGEEYEGESLLKSSEFGDGAYTCQENMIVIRRNRNTKTVTRYAGVQTHSALLYQFL